MVRVYEIVNSKEDFYTQKSNKQMALRYAGFSAETGTICWHANACYDKNRSALSFVSDIPISLGASSKIATFEPLKDSVATLEIALGIPVCQYCGD